MAMLFDQPLDEFSIDDLYGYNNTIIDNDFWDADEEKFSLGTLLPTPPLSPDQQQELKQETETFESWNTDAEVECYFSLNQSNSNIVLNDKIWCDEKTFTPTELTVDPMKHMTPVMEDMLLTAADLRPITPPTPIKTEHVVTPLKVDESPLKKPRLDQLPKFRLEKFPVIKIKEEPVSPRAERFFAPPPLKMSTESSFSDRSLSMTTVEIKEEPREYVPPMKSDIRAVSVSVKEELTFEIAENKHKELVLKEPRNKHRTRKRTCSESGVKFGEVKIEEGPIKTERRTSLRSSDSFSGGEDDAVIDLKRKLAEISSDSALSDDGCLSPKRRISHPNSQLAEEAASRLTLDQLKNLSTTHSHDEDEICRESCTKRFAHNVLERRRRNDLKSSYHRLQAEVPVINSSDRVSKVVILKKSAEYISTIEQEERENREELKRLRRHQKNLINKFRQLFKLTQQSTNSA